MKGENKMKKILFAIAIVLTIGFTANSQGRNDAFFNDWSNDGYNRTGSAVDLGLVLPYTIDMGTNDQDPGAPLGSGLLIMTAFGAGYAVARKRSKK